LAAAQFVAVSPHGGGGKIKVRLVPDVLPQ
jgi:hypothetical protein